MQFFLHPFSLLQFSFFRGETGNICEYGLNYDYCLGVMHVECSPKHRGIPLSNQNAIAMIHFMLDDLCRPTGKGFDARLEFSRLPLHFDGFVALARARTA